MQNCALFEALVKQASTLFRCSHMIGNMSTSDRLPDDPVEIDCGVCRLRAWRFDDLESLVLYGNDAGVSQGLRDRFPFPYTEADAHAYLGMVSALPVGERFAIEIDGRACGGIGIHLGEEVFKHNAEFGYWLGRVYWNNGIMTHVVNHFTAYAMPRFRLHRLQAQAYSNNPASMRVLEKAGFEREGVLHCAVVKRGELLDSIMYARVRRELTP